MSFRLENDFNQPNPLVQKHFFAEGNSIKNDWVFFRWSLATGNREGDFLCNQCVFALKRSVIKWLRTLFRKKKELKFNEFNLSAELLAEIEKAGFVEASPIQEQTIPLALEGIDVIGQAQTGTGKTAAFGLPTLEKIDVDNTVIQALCYCPDT